MYEEIIKKFKLKNIKVISVNTKEEATKEILKLIPEKSTIGYSGSMTLEQIGILDLIRNKNYVLFDRAKITKYTKESYNLGHKAQHANYFLTSSNAITKTGEIINTDRTGNRVSSMIYGPDKVIIIVGKNKIVNTIEEGLDRIKKIAAPLNAKRLKLNTPCTKTNKCMNCNSQESICCSTVIIRRQFKKDRITIIIINENLGY